MAHGPHVHRATPVRKLLYTHAFRSPNYVTRRSVADALVAGRESNPNGKDMSLTRLPNLHRSTKGGSRTLTPFRAPGFESGASTVPPLWRVGAPPYVMPRPGALSVELRSFLRGESNPQPPG